MPLSRSIATVAAPPSENSWDWLCRADRFDPVAGYRLEDDPVVSQGGSAATLRGDRTAGWAAVRGVSASPDEELTENLVRDLAHCRTGGENAVRIIRYREFE